MKHWKETLFVLALFALIVLLVFRELNSLNSLVNPKHTTIEEVNDSLQKQNTTIDTHIEIIEKRAGNLNQRIEKETKVLTTLKNIQDENLSHIHNASDEQLLEFFSKFKTQDSIY
ncbi:hypothetical protein [uncultured Algibacter sp.]|uniref:hypothetical protein n=1 Tax=uncultured Algibacter sp. TaxID=298659 RepID=UPI003217BCBE